MRLIMILAKQGTACFTICIYQFVQNSVEIQQKMTQKLQSFTQK